MKPSISLVLLILIVISSFMLSACGSGAPQPATLVAVTSSPEVSDTSSPVASATTTVTLTETSVPTDTFTPTAMFTPLPTATLTPTATFDWAELMKTQVHVYLVNVIDADTCNYETLPIPVPSRPKTGDEMTDIEWALKSLFLTKARQIGILINPLAASQLSFDSIRVDGHIMNVYLDGNVVETDNVCNDGQARDQVVSTVRQYVTDPNAEIVVWVGTYLLDDMLWRK